MRRKQNGAGARRPALFSFITFRREAFGGILFNPYLSAELELDPAETLISDMCTGKYPDDEIRARCRSSFDLTEEAAAEKVEATFAKLNGISALRFIDTPLPSVSPRAAFVPRVDGSTLSAPKSVIWDVTYACNLYCPHCLTDSHRKRSDELNTEEALRLIDTLADARVLYLSLAGGEPFLRGDISTLLRRLAETGMRVDIATNGYHISPKIIRELRDLPVFQIQVSIDGMGEQHDAFRGREGAFENACRTLRIFREEGISTSIGTTVTARNIDRLPELIDLALELGCDTFKAIPFIPSGRGKRNGSELEISKQGSLKLSGILSEKSRELAGRINIAMESTFIFLLDAPAPSCGDRCDTSMICSAGYDELSIGADGTVYPCPFLRDFPLGNLRADSLEHIWYDSPILRMLRTLEKKDMSGPCSVCEYAPLHCRGGCRASAFLACGDIKGSDPLCFRELRPNTFRE